MEDAILKALGIAGATAFFARAIRSFWRNYRKLYCKPREVYYDLSDWYLVEEEEERRKTPGA